MEKIMGWFFFLTPICVVLFAMLTERDHNNKLRINRDALAGFFTFLYLCSLVVLFIWGTFIVFGLKV